MTYDSPQHPPTMLAHRGCFGAGSGGGTHAFVWVCTCLPACGARCEAQGARSKVRLRQRECPPLNMCETVCACVVNVRQSFRGVGGGEGLDGGRASAHGCRRDRPPSRGHRPRTCRWTPSAFLLVPPPLGGGWRSRTLRRSPATLASPHVPFRQ